MRRMLIGLMALALFTTGCFDRINIEDASLSLIIGIDLDEKNHLVFSASSPVFNKEAKIKEEVYISRAMTLRKSREEDDKTFMALTVGGKTQMFLIGKRVMQHKGWLKLLESFQRDAKNTLNARIVMVDGKASDVIQFMPKDKPRLPLYLSKLIDTANGRNINVKSTLQDLRRATYEKGITASITQLRKDGIVRVTGTALLDEEGRYKLTVDPDENKLLRILQNRPKGVFSFTFKAPDQPKGEVFPANAYSFTADTISIKTRTGYTDDRFRFDIDVKMKVILAERMFPLDIRKKANILERDIEQEFEKRFKRFTNKIQKAKIDPIGLGLYARAFEYKHWKPIQERWGETLAKGEVNVKVKVKISSMGVIR